MLGGERRLPGASSTSAVTSAIRTRRRPLSSRTTLGASASRRAVMTLNPGGLGAPLGSRCRIIVGTCPYLDNQESAEDVGQRISDGRDECTDLLTVPLASRSDQVGRLALHETRSSGVADPDRWPVDDEEWQLAIDVEASTIGERSTDWEVAFEPVRDLFDQPVADDRGFASRCHVAPFGPNHAQGAHIAGLVCEPQSTAASSIRRVRQPRLTTAARGIDGNLEPTTQRPCPVPLR